MKVTVDSKDQGERVDKFVELKLKDMGFKQVTRSMIKDDIALGVDVNGDKANPSYRLKVGDKVEIDREYWDKFFKSKDFSGEIKPEKGELKILFEDSDLIVLYKPKGLVAHPGVGNREGTLANYLKYYLQSKNEYDNSMDRAGIVHRLDKGVSGLMVVAKNKVVQEKLKKQFANRKVEKIYLAHVEKFKSSELSSIEQGELDKVLKQIEEGEINYDNWFEAKGYIGRDKRDRYKMVFKLYEFGGSKSAKSYILPLKDDKLLIKIVTGRMHQIRATLKYYGYYIKGDTLYNRNTRGNNSDEIMLESIYLSFKHPVTGKKISFINTD
ncbi:MAG: pseudouridine synthase [candidate division WS6 bacterium 34_10]|uniref:Pseudouridine synthase n=1 Tax=candidate division WS6 bacterium 34_10 TaxID=1641389 RepID=A0A101HIE5_9BACT|nr:MAG: pseudouridine synthase [candidate division WS6 bacterium 34_10]